MDDEIDLIFESTEDGNIGDVHDQDRNDEIAGFDTETEEELESLDNKEPDDDKLK